jgi:predicted ATPase
VDAQAGLGSLVDKSLLRVEEDVDGQPWYVMLETVREFALEQLAASSEAQAIWRRHALYYLRLVEQLEPGLQTLPQDVFVNRLEREHANCRAALDWCQAHGYAEVCLRLAVGLWWFWAVRGYRREGWDWLAALLALAVLRPLRRRWAAAEAAALRPGSQ